MYMYSGHLCTCTCTSSSVVGSPVVMCRLGYYCTPTVMDTHVHVHMHVVVVYDSED